MKYIEVSSRGSGGVIHRANDASGRRRPLAFRYVTPLERKELTHPQPSASAPAAINTSVLSLSGSASIKFRT